MECGEYNLFNVDGIRNRTNLFFLFFQKNGTVESNRYTVNRGFKMPLEVGQVIRFNGKHKMDVWPGEECNKIQGTDTTIYRPFITPEISLSSFSGDVCR